MNLQFQWRGTGIVYTPPQLSDHVPISLLLSVAKNTAMRPCSEYQVSNRFLSIEKKRKLTDYFHKRRPQEEDSKCKSRKAKEARDNCELVSSEDEGPKLDPGYST